MERLVKTVIIDAPVESVFAYVSEPENHPRFWPHMNEVRDVRRLPSGGASYWWPYTLNGKARQGNSEDIAFVPNERIVTRSEAAIDSTISWTFEPLDERTKLTVEVEFVVVIPMPNPITESLIHAVNEREIDSLLVNLQGSAMLMRTLERVGGRWAQLS